MTLRGYLKIFRQRWLLILACTLVAAGVVFAITPAQASDAPPASSYTATATLLAPEYSASLSRIALYVTAGEVPVKAAEQLGYTGDPVLLAAELTVTADPSAQAITIAATHADGQVAADRANAFAEATVEYANRVEQDNLTILQYGSPIPNLPTGGAGVIPPDRGSRTALGAAIGLLLGLGLAIVLDHLDARLRTRDEIHEATGLPVVAEIPKLPRSDRRAGAIIVRDEPLSMYADGYRAARAALLHTAAPAGELRTARGTDVAMTGFGGSAKPSTAGQVILVTSALAGEGKTTTVANIAASFAEADQRVLVIDADLRSPDIHLLFDVPQGVGASDYLTNPDGATLDSLARPTNVRGVSLVTAGTRLDNPVMLTSRMAPLISAARQISDVVILDASPLLMASDAFDLLPLVDNVLLVARSGRITAVAAQRVAELLGRFPANVAGVAVIGAPQNGSAGYGYGYGYGYGDRRKRSKRAAQQEPENSVTQVPQAAEPTDSEVTSISMKPIRSLRPARRGHSE